MMMNWRNRFNSFLTFFPQREHKFSIYLSLIHILIDKVTHSYKTAFFYKMLMVFNPVFFVYASYYYTDTIAIPVSIAAVLCVVTAFQSEKLKKYIFLFFSGILFAAAAKIRVVTLIIVIAIVVYLIYEGLWKSLFRLLTLFGLSLIHI